MPQYEILAGQPTRFSQEGKDHYEALTKFIKGFRQGEHLILFDPERHKGAPIIKAWVREEGQEVWEGFDVQIGYSVHYQISRTKTQTCKQQKQEDEETILIEAIRRCLKQEGLPEKWQRWADIEDFRESFITLLNEDRIHREMEQIRQDWECHPKTEIIRGSLSPWVEEW